MLNYLVTGLLVTMPAPVMPSSLAVPAPLDVPAPFDVRLAWDPGTPPTRFVITWQESSPQRNRVEMILADGGPSGEGDSIVEADEPNRASGLGQFYFNKDYRFRITAIDADGAALSEPALSPAFDTDAAPVPVLRRVVPRPDGTILMQWDPGEPLQDDTPNDPLDLPDPQRFIPIVSRYLNPDYDELSAPSAATTFIVPPRPMAGFVGVKTVPNGWAWTAATAEINGSRLTAVVPETATDGRPLRVTGTAYRNTRACDKSVCFPGFQPEDGRMLELQSRTGPTAAWRVVATTRSVKDGGFRFSVTSPGSRQYRVVAQAIAWAPGKAGQVFFATVPASTTSRPPATAPSGTPDPGAPGPGAPEPDPGDGGGTGAGGPLPITGGPVTTVVGSGGLLVAIGVLLCWAARRRRAS